MKTRFNLASSPLENNRRFVAGAGLVGLLGLAAMFFLSQHAYRAWGANRVLRADVARLDTQIRDAQRQQEVLRGSFKSPQTKQILDRSAFLNALITERSFPWTKMFMDLEKILPPGVRVVSIAPQMDKEGNVRVSLVVGATGDEEKLKFLESLGSSPVFSDVTVTDETHPAHSAAPNADHVLLSLEARYQTL